MVIKNVIYSLNSDRILSNTVQVKLVKVPVSSLETVLLLALFLLHSSSSTLVQRMGLDLVAQGYGTGKKTH
jgi:hypothetical protein